MIITKLSIRTILFKLGIAATTFSAALFIGSFARHVQATTYLKQGEEGIPWVQWGLGSALLGLVLSWFGQRLARMIAVTISFLLLLQWMFAGESLF